MYTTEKLNYLKMKNLLTNPDVQSLVNQFDLTLPKMYNIMIDVYSVEDNKLIIKHASVLDENLKPLREANLSKLVEFLPECNVVFKKL